MKARPSKDQIKTLIAEWMARMVWFSEMEEKSRSRGVFFLDFSAARALELFFSGRGTPTIY